MDNWLTEQELENNRKQLIQELEKKLNKYEQRYELKSENLMSAFRAARIKDTAEICEWAIIYDFYKKIKKRT